MRGQPKSFQEAQRMRLIAEEAIEALEEQVRNQAQEIHELRRILDAVVSAHNVSHTDLAHCPEVCQLAAAFVRGNR